MTRSGNTAGRRLQRANASEVRGDSHRAAAIAAHSAGRTARSNRCRFAAARPAGRAVDIPGIGSPAVQRVVAFVTHEHVRDVRRAEHDRARLLQPRHAHRIGRGNGSLPRGRTGFDPQAIDFDSALNRHRQAAERTTRPTGRGRFILRARLGDGTIAAHLDECVQARIQPLDLREVVLNDVQG